MADPKRDKIKDKSTTPFDLAGTDFLRLAPHLWDPVSLGMVEVTAPQPGERVLDACCGIGSSAIPTSRAVGISGWVDALDTSSAMIDILLATKSLPNWLHPQCTDVLTWNPSYRYDLVQCSLGISFFPIMSQGVKHLASLTTFGGRIAISVWRNGALAPIWYVFSSAWKQAFGKSLDEFTSPTSAINSPQALSDWFESQGLNNVRTKQHELRIPLNPEIAWLIVTGSAWRGFLQELNENEQTQLHGIFVTMISEQALTELDVTTLIAIGTPT